MTRDRLRPAALARQVLLPPVVGGVGIACVLIVLTAAGGRAKNPPARGDAAELAWHVSTDVEGTPTSADVRRARRPRSERRRLLATHPYFELYEIAKRRFGVSWFLVASVHYQDTGFGKAPARLARWRRFRFASRGLVRPAHYPHRSASHPSLHDDLDVVMAIAAELKAAGATGLGPPARRAAAVRYGTDAGGELSSAMVVERARAWKLLGTLPLPAAASSRGLSRASSAAAGTSAARGLGTCTTASTSSRRRARRSTPPTPERWRCSSRPLSPAATATSSASSTDHISRRATRTSAP